MKQEKKTVSALNLTEKQRKEFKMNLHMGLELAHLSDAFLSRSEEVLRQSGDWRLDLKQHIKKASAQIEKVTQYTDKYLGNQENYFYNDVKFLDALMLVLIERATDSEKQEKIINIVKCMNL